MIGAANLSGSGRWQVVGKRPSSISIFQASPDSVSQAARAASAISRANLNDGNEPRGVIICANRIISAAAHGSRLAARCAARLLLSSIGARETRTLAL